jgi:AraC-like DNA-binding protein
MGEDIYTATDGLAAALWPGEYEHPPMGTPRTAMFLRTYRVGSNPIAGSMPFGEVDVDGPWHYHDTHQLMCPFEGTLVVEVEGGRHLIPRQLATWIPAGVPHRMNLRQLRSASIFFPKHMVEHPGNRIRAVIVSPLMREMAKEAMRWPLHTPDTPQRSAFFTAMAYYCNEWIENEADLFLPTSDDPRLEGALQYTADNMDKKLPEICRHAGMSERSFRRHLKSAYGMSWEQYRTQIRLLRAVGLLGETDFSIDEVAARCGFETPSGFSRVFRAAMNQSPRAYRNHIRSV